MRKISLTQGKFAIVDDEDFELINQYKWYAQRNKRRNTSWYAKTYIRTRGMIQMGKFLLNPLPGMLCDHINRNGLDNRRSNLRICTYSQNSINRRLIRGYSWGYLSKYRGVTKMHRRGQLSKPWIARISHNRKQIHLGTFSTEREAAEAYDEAALKYHGEFAHLNFHAGRRSRKRSQKSPAP